MKFQLFLSFILIFLLLLAFVLYRYFTTSLSRKKRDKDVEYHLDILRGKHDKWKK